MSKSTNSPVFKIGGDLEVRRLGFGAMRITGSGIWGHPQDREEALRTLRRVLEVGVDFIDTADSYGPNVSEELIREALHPYRGVAVATKAGLVRTGPDQWTPLGRPEYLIQQAYASRMRLRVERIDLWQLHRIDPRVPRGEQFDAIRSLQSAGVIRHAGLSEVSVEEIEAAGKYFRVATVQNLFNLFERQSAKQISYCEANGIGFIPWFPLGAGGLTRHGAELDEIGKKHGATSGQIALAWLLQYSPVMLPIPGTSRRVHLEQNVKARDIELKSEEMKALSSMSR